MKLRTKLVWAGIMVVLIPMLLSAGMMWLLIQWQNTKDTKQRSGNLIDAIRREIDRQASELVAEMLYLSQDATLLSHITFLLSQSKENGAVITKSLDEFYKTEIGVSLANFAKVNAYNMLVLFDKNYQLVSYIHHEDENYVLGIVSQDEDGTPIVKTITKERVILGKGEANPNEWGIVASSESVPMLYTEQITKPTSSIAVFEGKVVLKTAVPIRSDRTDPSSPTFGGLVGYQYISQDFITRLSEQTQAHVNFFVGSDLYAGTLPEFSKTPTSDIEKLRQSSTMTPDRPYLYTELVIEEHPYYQAYYPLVQEEDGGIQSTLVLSVSKEPTYQKTRQAVMLQSLVSIIAVFIIIPVTFLLAERLAKPIQTIAGISESIANGHIDQYVEPLQSEDEIGILSRAFMRLVTYIQSMATIATEISRGKLLQTTKPRSEQDVLGHAFQNMSAYLNEMATAATAIAGGDIRQDIQPKTEDDVLGNAFKELIAYIQANAQVAEQLAQGDLSVNVTVLSDKDVLGKSFHRMVETLKAIMTEINVLIASVGEGKLTVRGEVEQFEGEYARIVTGINVTLDAVIGPLMVAADYMRRIAIGDFPEPLTEEYQGDFNTIKENLNLLIQASHDVTRLAEEMASGNLLIELRERSTHDTLMRALNAMIQELKNVVINVKATANNVATSSEELSSSAEMMSQGASQQAAAAEEASAAMEQMVSNIRQNADNARQTEQIALQSAQYAEEGSNVIVETVVVMQQIAQKITIIKEIAEQTRMLSLNATIEAARAQEHGKAFSVVAAEVRKLSDITKKAAEQIDQLAASSLDVSEKAAQMLETLVPSIHRTAELVQEITAASSEQSVGAEHVNAAIHQLDQVTQQNAASADGIASTAETMSIQANQLQHTIEFFKIGN